MKKDILKDLLAKPGRQYSVSDFDPSFIGELSKQDAYYEQIQMDRLADLLEASEKEIEEYAVINIVPLQETRRKLKDEISSLSLRINRAENKVRKANEKVHAK